MAKASPEDLKALFDTQQGYDALLQRMRTTTTTTTTIVFRRRRLFFFCFPFLLAARSCIIIFIVFRLSLFFACAFVFESCASRGVVFGVFVERSEAWPKPSVEWRG